MRRSATRRLRFLPSALVILAACAGSPDPEVAPIPDALGEAARAADLISSDGVLAHVEFLASDELAGRDTPSPGLEAAAEYIARRFEELGLEPRGDAGEWLQRYPYDRGSFDAGASTLEARGPAGGAALAFGEQWFALPTRPGATVVEAPTVYAGSAGRTSFPSGAAGTVLAVTTGPELGMELFGLIVAATEADAAGLLLILHPEIPDAVLPMIVSQVAALPEQAIPVAGVLRSAASELFAAGGRNIDAVAPVEGPAGEEPELVDLGVTMTIEAAMRRESFTPPNVVGVLRGSDPVMRDTYVLYSAHFDHVGIGAPDADGDSIYNGADDDASGTALLLEVARAFAALPEPPSRSILFLAVSGEEKGLLGARYWASNPTVPIEQVVANINADMVGRNAPDTLIGIGAEYSTLGPLAEGVATGRPELGLVVGPDPDPSEGAFFRSDHVAFVRAQIPALFLTTWLHEDYHQPSDELDGIDGDKLARVSRFAYWLGWEIARSQEPPAWNPGAWEEVQKVLENSPF